MSTLHHPNVLMFIGAVMDPDAGNICLVTELCVKGDLYTYLHDPETRMTWKRRLIMATDVARGMLYLHRRAGSEFLLRVRGIRGAREMELLLPLQLLRM